MKTSVIAFYFRRDYQKRSDKEEIPGSEIFQSEPIRKIQIIPSKLFLRNGRLHLSHNMLGIKFPATFSSSGY